MTDDSSDLDRAIGERVMGYTPGDMARSGYPQFSTNLALAWLVRDRMRAHKTAPNLLLVCYAYNRTYAKFTLGDFDAGEEGWSEGNGDDATPHAICLAALAVVPEGAGPEIWHDFGVRM